MFDTRGGETRFGRALSALKRRGSLSLVVGDVPSGTFDRISARFLGRAPGRVRVFAITDVGIDRATHRLERAAPGREPAIVVDAGTGGSRSAAAAPGREIRSRLDVRTVEPSLGALEGAVRRAVADARGRFGPLDPAALRLCVDLQGFRPEADDATTLVGFLDAVGNGARDAAGMAHVLLPVAPTTDLVGELRPHADVTVELRKTNAVAEQRWTLRDYGIRTPWTELGAEGAPRPPR